MKDLPESLSRRLLDDLIGRGAITERWAGALHSVPRHLFVPDVIYRHDRGLPGNDLVPMNRADDEAAWLDLVYSDEAITTQVDDGRPAADGSGFEVTSSSSQPQVVAHMLAELDAQPGERVLEIGTGTGWNAALLAHRVGAANVTTVEIDRDVAAHARAALDAHDCAAVTTVVGDGSAGWPDGSPYDRLMSTVGVAEIPWAWVEQVRPGGRIVAPLTSGYRAPGVLVLTRHGNGSAMGRLAGPAAFMGLRAGREPRVRGCGGSDADAAVVTSTTDLHPYYVTGDRAAAIAIGTRVNGIWWVFEPDGGLGTLWLYAPAARSWATVRLREVPPHAVEQAGSRLLWDEVTDAYRWWRDAGEPGVEDWLVVVDRHCHRMTLSPTATSDPSTVVGPAEVARASTRGAPASHTP